MFLDRGENEHVKGLIHGALLSFAGMCAVYNVFACRKRREPHLAVNACLYLGLVGWELWQVGKHLREDKRQ